MLDCCVLLGLDWAEPMMLFMLHITCSCIFMHTYLHFFIFLYWFVWFFSACLSFPLSFLCLSALWYLNANLLRPKTLFFPQHLLLLPPLTPLHLTSNSMMINPVRTFGELLTTRHSFETPSRSIRLFRYWPSHSHLQSGLGVTMWHLGHLSLRDHTGVLLQYAWIRLFNTWFCHSRLRYVHRSHSGYCIRGTTRS